MLGFAIGRAEKDIGERIVYIRKRNNKRNGAECTFVHSVFDGVFCGFVLRAFAGGRICFLQEGTELFLCRALAQRGNARSALP